MQIDAVNAASRDLLKIQNDLKIIDSELQNTSKSSKLSSRSFKGFGESANKIGSDLSKKLTLPIVAVGGAMLKMASDGEETRSKFDTIFKDMVSGANEVADNFAKSYGLAGASAREMLGNTSDLLTGLNFTQEAALGLSEQANQLAVDLASFTNYSGGAKGASEALTKALLGEREGLKALGISISEEDVKTQMLVNSKAGMTFETEKQAKAQATLDLAMQQSKNAIGDYARTSDSAANQSRLFQENLKELGETFGSKILPIFTDLVKSLNDIAIGFTGMSDEAQNTILVAGFLVAAIGRVIKIIGSLAIAIDALGVALAFVAANPVVILIGALVALGTFFIMLGDKSDSLMQKIGHAWEIIREATIENSEKMKAFLTEIWDAITGGISASIEFIKGIIQSGGSAMSSAWSAIWGGIQSVVSSVWGGIESLVVGGVNAVIAAINLLIAGLNKIPGIALPAFDKVTTAAERASRAAGAAALQSRFGTSDVSEVLNTVMGLPQKAFGGDVRQNRPYMVGEGGAEVFIPSTAGKIIPNNQLGGGVNINNIIGNVVVQNEADENRLVDKIKQALTRDMQLKSIGSNA